ncbi:ImmA/IrrE family metallo-endopeptidase [Arthrobacter sp. STN4]|uniref:ImmA/IrrE family metallo-endopeptidase n=1 Tax=Arthrobacter sp. STN4 TaxID=2923276 RepID=UPI00211A4AB4|nr:ImmA/IrrE family metallo-endopeptidase [Arthrobacter sp. STN4]MCQ9163608.1 ImmA/IrrE family metallo-endopeptidase [Arthrobacter sp. STN4]
MNPRERAAHRETAALRGHYGLGVAPIADMHELVETMGSAILVAVLPMPEGMDAMVVKDPKRHRTVVGVATTNVPGRQRLSLAHELAHIVHDDYLDEIPPDCSARTDSEKDADTFARHLLAPLEGIRGFVSNIARGRPLELRDLSSLTRHFNVSPSVILIQLSILGLITPSQAEDFRTYSARTLSTRFGWLDDYKASATESSTPRPPRSLMERATEGYEKHVIHLNALARLGGEDPLAFLAELKDAGIVPQPRPSVEDSRVSDADFFGLDAV